MRAFDASYMAGGMDAYALRDNGSTPSSSADYEDIEGEDQGSSMNHHRERVCYRSVADPDFRSCPKEIFTYLVI
ncbi:hypothetical protein AVEN_98718-1 [Araneus ventricosus]|uniref:Uncharacterized protein n=1 Tax=Araneus ventricosus TaxID=182803 RepID=A0A4Y2HFX9_ARAVE|nr:hypothetical protein AVEN_98718-1 [Araneus ventricosus]